MDEEWERQKREIDSYNIFFSAIKGEVTGQGLLKHGYRIVGRFLDIPDPYNEVEASPDFVLFDGETLLLVEVKSGENISERDREQMKECDQLGIEAAQNYLSDTDIQSKGYDPNGLRYIQPCIIYYEDFIEECKTFDGCEDALVELKEYAAVLTQDKGSVLQLEGGNVVSEDIDDVLSDGIPLPQLPDKNVYLTEGIEKESLAVSICYDCVQNNMGKGRLTISETDIMEYYSNREIPMDRISDVLKFLDDVGACRETDDGQYEFTTGHMRNIVGIEQNFEDNLVDEWLEGEAESQKSLSDF